MSSLEVLLVFTLHHCILFVCFSILTETAFQWMRIIFSLLLLKEFHLRNLLFFADLSMGKCPHPSRFSWFKVSLTIATLTLNKHITLVKTSFY